MKEWTILLYENGNNELEPETWNMFLDIENNVNELNNINVVLQLSRAPIEDLRILRPNYHFSQNNRWSGTRRFFYDGNHFEIIENIKNVNMANPLTLYEFIVWATNIYPAKRYILAFGGHVYQFVGLLADYSQNKPYIAGFPELASAIEEACKKQQINIDILILDTCYSSTFEVLYEFGKSPQNYIKYLFTYIEKGPIMGLCYSEIVKIIEQYSSLVTTQILKMLVLKLCQNSDLSLIVYQLDSKLLELYKRLFSDIAHAYFSSNPSKLDSLTPYEILAIENTNYPWTIFLSYLSKTIPLSILEIKDNSKTRKHLLPVHVLYTKIPDEYRKSLYMKLSFANNNDWFNLIADNPTHEFFNSIPQLSPIEISQNILYTMISTSNNNLSESANRKIVEQFIKHKKWSLKTL